MKFVIAIVLLFVSNSVLAMTAAERATGVQRISDLTFQLTEEGQECSSSFWCLVFEHCVNGQCVPKDFFNQCDIFNPCAWDDECVNGVCE